MAEPRMLQAEGNPIWFDLVSSDADASARFYGELFGWDFASIDMGGGNVYHLAIDDDRNIAGIGQRPPHIAIGERDSIWLTHLYTADVYATRDKIVEQGGQEVTAAHDIEIPGQSEIVGARCTVRNPAGGVFSLWQSGIGQGCEVFGEVGTFCWVEYHTPNVQAAMQWHNGVFGMEFDAFEIPADGDSPGATLHMLRSEDQEPHCAFVEVPGDRMLTGAPFWMNYVMVADIEAAAERARSLGAEIPFAVESVPFGSYVTIIDPQDAVISLWQQMDD